MNLNRTIKLNRAIRQQMVARAEQAWLRQNPRPTMGVAPTGMQLRSLDNWKRGRAALKVNFLNALDTFKSVNELAELWPTALKFVPDYLVDPEKHFDLPEAA